MLAYKWLHKGGFVATLWKYPRVGGEAVVLLWGGLGGGWGSGVGEAAEGWGNRLLAACGFAAYTARHGR